LRRFELLIAQFEWSKRSAFERKTLLNLLFQVCQVQFHCLDFLNIFEIIARMRRQYTRQTAFVLFKHPFNISRFFVELENRKGKIVFKKSSSLKLHFDSSYIFVFSQVVYVQRQQLGQLLDPLETLLQVAHVYFEYFRSRMILVYGCFAEMEQRVNVTCKPIVQLVV
jgi:hypothetical protein